MVMNIHKICKEDILILSFMCSSWYRFTNMQTIFHKMNYVTYIMTGLMNEGKLKPVDTKICKEYYTNCALLVLAY